MPGDEPAVGPRARSAGSTRPAGRTGRPCGRPHQDRDGMVRGGTDRSGRRVRPTSGSPIRRRHGSCRWLADQLALALRRDQLRQGGDHGSRSPAGATRSRARCSIRCRTTCARRSPASGRQPGTWQIQRWACRRAPSARLPRRSDVEAQRPDRLGWTSVLDLSRIGVRGAPAGLSRVGTTCTSSSETAATRLREPR